MKHKEPDRKAPRFRRNSYHTNLSILSLWPQYNELTGLNLTYEQFKDLYITNMETLIEIVTTERNGITLPEQMGRMHLALFKISKRKPYIYYSRGKGLSSDTKTTSFEAEGLQGKIFWDYKETKYKFRDYIFYGFVACREFKRAASQAFIHNPDTFPRYIYMVRIGENRKKKRLEKKERYERYKQGSDQPVEDTE